MNNAIVALLRCPITGQPLTFHDDGGQQPYLQTRDGSYRYPVENGIAMLLAEDAQKLDKALSKTQ